MIRTRTFRWERGSYRRRNTPPESMLDKLTKNFAVISTSLTGFASALAMVLVFSYLSVFDWTLIWLIEYSDLLKFFLIGIAIASGSMFLVLWLLEDVHDWLYRQRKQLKWLVGFLIVLWLVVLAFQLYGDLYTSERPAKEYHVGIFILQVLLLILILSLFHYYNNREQITWTVVGKAFFGVLFFLTLLGRIYGVGIRDLPSKTHDIFLRSDMGEVASLKNATIVMILSHHTVLRVGDDIITIPSSDIAKIVSKNAHRHRKSPSSGGGK